MVVTVLPILFVILIGQFSLRSGLVPAAHWPGIDTLMFKVLLPVTLAHAIATSDLAEVANPVWTLGLLATLGLATVGLLGLRRALSHRVLKNPEFTSLFQAITRWNGFIALAAAQQFVGAEGFALIALGMAVLIPVLNIGNIAIMVRFGPDPEGNRKTAKDYLLPVLKNPLVLGCLLGLAINLSALPLPAPLVSTTEMISRATLTISLLTVGAGLSLPRLLRPTLWILVGTTARLIGLPLIFLAFALCVGLTRTEALAGCLIFAVPAASNGYVIAKRMGGDAGLYADLLTWQTVTALALLPFWAWGIGLIF